jgi:hypothetical protein
MCSYISAKIIKNQSKEISWCPALLSALQSAEMREKLMTEEETQ